VAKKDKDIEERIKEDLESPPERHYGGKDPKDE
jgi:hypothetical protein